MSVLLVENIDDVVVPLLRATLLISMSRNRAEQSRPGAMLTIRAR